MELGIVYEVLFILENDFLRKKLFRTDYLLITEKKFTQALNVNQDLLK